MMPWRRILGATLAAASIARCVAAAGAPNDSLYESLGDAIVAETWARTRDLDLARTGTPSRRARFVKTYAGTPQAAQLELDDLRAAKDKLPPAEVIARCRSLLERYPHCEFERMQAVRLLSTIWGDRRQPVVAESEPEADPVEGLLGEPRLREEPKTAAILRQPTRRAAFDAALPHLAGWSNMLDAAGGYVAELPLPEEERYALAKRAEESCGPRVTHQEFLWRFLEPLARTWPAERFCTEVDRYVERYGGDLPGPAAARLAAVGARGRAGDAAAAAEFRRETDRRAERAKALAEAFAKAVSLIAAGDHAAALVALDSLPVDTPVALAHPAWAAFRTQVEGKRLLEPLPADVRFELGRRLLAGVLPGPESRAALRWLSVAADRQEWLDLVLANPEKLAHDKWESRFEFDGILRSAAVADAPTRRSDVLRAAADAARSFGDEETAVKWLTELARTTWITRPEIGRAALAELGRAPDPLRSAVPEWTLAMLDGRITMATTPLPRSPRHLDTRPAEFAQPAVPAVALPALTEAVDGAIRLAAQPRDANLLAGRPTLATSGTATAAAAVDADMKQSAWCPESLPASLTVQLARPVSLEFLRVSLVEPCHFSVSLLDHAGAVVARYERDGGFPDDVWEPWTPNPAEFVLPPTPVVAFVRVELFKPQGEVAGVTGIEARAAAFPARANHLLPAEPLPADATAVTLSGSATEPSREVAYPLLSENHLAFPYTRWDPRPWYCGTPKLLGFQRGRDYMLEFFGTGLDATVTNMGDLQWVVDGRERGSFLHDPPYAERSQRSADASLVRGLPEGRHLAWLRVRKVPFRQDSVAGDWIHFTSLRVAGRSTARMRVRFGDGREAWGPWHEGLPLDGSGFVRVPAGPRPSHVQAAVAFDSRGLLAAESAEVRDLSVTFDESPADALAGTEIPAIGPPPASLPEEVSLAAEVAASRRPVVAYPQAGTRAEYDAARAIAAKIGAYLAPDDIGMIAHLFDGPVVAVGTPQRSRLNRRLIAQHRVWQDPAFLADSDGVVGLVRGFDGEPVQVAVTGETAAGVVAAAERLLAALPEPSAAAAPFSLSQASTLDVVYPWLLTGRPAADGIAIRMATNDRRSAQVALVADAPLADLAFACDGLASDSGDRLAVRVRHAACYDSPQMLASLRVPNLLVDSPRLPVPANTATGLWLTVATGSATRPAVYRGTLRVTAAGHEETLPVRVTVEPVPLPPLPATTTHSLARLPDGAADGGVLAGGLAEQWAAGFAANEAEHGINAVTVGVQVAGLRFHHFERPVLPTGLVVAAADAGVPGADAAWTTPAQPPSVEPGKAVVFRLPALTAVKEIGLVVEGAEGTTVVVERAESGRWAPLGEIAIAKGRRASPRLAVGGPLGVFRVRGSGAAPLVVRSAAVLADTARRHPFDVDFTGLDREIEIYEAAYRDRGLPPPLLVVPVAAPRIGHRLGTPDADFSRETAEQMVAHFRANGRLDRLLAKVHDEPASLPVWAGWARPFHEGGLATMTCHNFSPGIEETIGLMNPWCPNYLHDVHNPFFAERRRAGDTLWWYCCGSPVTRNTGRPTENLPFWWLTAKWRFAGAMSFSAAHFNSDSKPFWLDHGLDHRVAFLPDGRVVDTPRRELEADGIADLKLVEFIRGRAAALRAAGDPTAAADLDRRVDAILADTVPDRFDYAETPGPWEAARNRLYDLAVAAAR